MIVSAIYNLVLFVLIPIDEWKGLKGYCANSTVDISVMKQYVHSIIITAGGRSDLSVGVFAVALGVLFSFCAFLLLNTKKSVNFYLSVGIDRKTLFFNRVKSSVLAMAATVFIPVAVSVIMNIATFGNAKYIVEYGLFIGIAIFVLMLMGFSIMSIAMAACLTIPDSLFTGAGLVALPSILSLVYSCFANGFLRGFRSDMESDFMRIGYFNPLLALCKSNVTQAVNRLTRPKSNDLWAFLSGYTYEDSTFSLGGYEFLDFKFILPFVVWIPVCAVLLGIAYFVLKGRKTENTNIIRRSHGASLIVSAEIGMMVSIMAVQVLSNSNYAANSLPWIVKALIIFACVLISMAIVHLISYASIKKVKRWLIPSAGFAAIIAVAAGVFLTGGLGYSTYTPNVDEIESVKVSTSHMNEACSAGTRSYYYSPYDGFDNDNNALNTLGEFRDKQTTAIVNDTIAASAKDADSREYKTTSVHYEYKLKNGKTIDRYYENISVDAIRALSKLAQTAEYQKKLEEMCIGTSLSKEETENCLYVYDDNMSFGASYDVYGDYDDLNYDTYKCCYGLLHFGKASVISPFSEDGDVELENTDELRAALFSDLKKVGYANLFSNEKELFCILFERNLPEAEAEDEEYYYIDSEHLLYPIYANMTDTIAYFKDKGLMDSINKLMVPKGVVKAEVIDLPNSFLLTNFMTGYYKFEMVSLNSDADNNYYEDYDSMDIIAEYSDKNTINSLISKSRSTGLYEQDDCILRLKFKDYTAYRIIKKADLNLKAGK